MNSKPGVCLILAGSDPMTIYIQGEEQSDELREGAVTFALTLLPPPHPTPHTHAIAESEGLGVVDNQGKEVVKVLGGKGGGKKGVVMGKGGGRENLEEAKKILIEGM